MSLAKILEQIYFKYNKRELVHPDPLEFLYRYKRISDREVVGIIASSLAYGRVNQILKSVETIISAMGDSPHDFIMHQTSADFGKIFAGFKHRFNTGNDIAELLRGMKISLEKYGSLDNNMNYLRKREGNFINALNRFSEEINPCGGYLLPKPENGSPCKRLMLFLRWMVRSDEVDPGGWKSLTPAELIVPLDTHMFSAAKMLGFTKKNTASFAASLEITEAFREFSPNDPVKYDFALTRFGIHPDMSKDELEAILT